MSRTILLLTTLGLSLSPLALAADDDSWLTRSGYYRISYKSELEPIEINRIHSWVVHVESPAGEPLLGAEILVTGGMPLHNHGLPTDPRMTTEIGNGDYLLEGIRFHMNGYWELLVTIDVGGKRDTVIVPLNL